MPVCSLAIRSIRVRGKPQALARAPADIFSGTRNSSRRTSPGCMGLSFLAIAASSLVVVHNLDLRRAVRRPNKAHPELVVDPDRVLSLAVARQRLETVAWRRPQVVEIVRGVEVTQLPARHLDQIGWKTLCTFAVENGLGGLVPEAPDHKELYQSMIQVSKLAYQSMIQDASLHPFENSTVHGWHRNMHFTGGAREDACGALRARERRRASPISQFGRWRSQGTRTPVFAVRVCSPY